jgi:serine/threonine protein kinase
MSAWIGDSTLAHLRDVTEWPDAGERYEVRGKLGRGGMGVVYAARDRILGRDVAIKVLDTIEPSADAARRLEDEARILGRLEHPGIVPVHDAGRLADGRAFYVMKLVRGERLDVALDGKPALNERLDLFLRICDAVSFAHAQGIVHRDLKPQNVMLGQFGEVLVMDWGVAKIEASSAIDDAIVGTPGYMAPEQVRHAAAVDARADVFALGVILDAMLPAPPPKPLAAIARLAQAERADQRYDSVQAMARDIGLFREGHPVSAYAESAVERLTRVYTRYRVPIMLVTAYLIMRVVLAYWLRV